MKPSFHTHGRSLHSCQQVVPGGGDQVPPGIFYGTVKYRTRDGRADYVFSFEQQSNGSWRAYIVSQPSYGLLRDKDCHTTHRLTDGGRHYVCWTNELRSLSELRQVAALWADSTQNYIRTGKRF